MNDILKFIQSFKTKKNTVFLLFVLGTSIFWFIHKLSNEYLQVIELPVEYTDLPSQFIFQEDAPKIISVRLKASGFYLFKTALKGKTVSLSLRDISKANDYNYYLTNNKIYKQIKSQFKKNVEVEYVLEDQLTFKLGKRSFKKVPVIPNVMVDYSLGYNSFTGVEVIPDSIVVSGPEMQLEKIDKINLEPLVRQQINKSFTEGVRLIKPDLPKIDFERNKVDLKLNVEQVTEKTIKIPLVLKNTSKEKVVVFPKKIKLSFWVSLMDFNKIKEEDFSLVCDYSKRGDKFMEVNLIKHPKHISNIKLYTNKVEYLILK